MANVDQHLLQVESLAKTYPTRSRDLVILKNITLTLRGGQSAAIMGPSGSGKSTLLNILGTLEPPTSGRVSLDGTDPFILPPKELAGFRNRRVGFVFQDHHLLPQCSVLENVLMPTLARPSSRTRGDATSTNGGEDNLTRAKRLLERVGLSERLDHRPAELSGGERQRVAIARAMVNRPALLLADEPTGNLDRTTAENIAELLAQVYREDDTILIVVTHSQRLAERFDQRWELIDGTLVSSKAS